MESPIISNLRSPHADHESGPLEQPAVLSKLCDAVVPQFPWKRIIVRVWRPAMRLNSPAIKWPEKNQAPNKQILRTAADRSCQSNRNAMQSYVRLYVLLYTLTIIEYNLHVYNIYIYHTHANTHWHTCLTFYDRAQNNCLKPGQSSRHCLLSDRRAAELLAAYACIAIPLIFWCCKISWHLFTFGYSSTVDVDTLGESSCRYAHAYTLTRMETDGKAWSRCSHLKLHKDAMAGLWTVWRWQEIHRVLKILHRVNLPWTPMFESLIHNKTRTASTKKRQHERHGKWKTAHMHREGNRNHLCILSIPFMQCMSMSRLSHNVLPSAQESPERRSTGLNCRSRWINDGSTDQPSRRKTMKNHEKPTKSKEFNR